MGNQNEDYLSNTDLDYEDILLKKYGKTNDLVFYEKLMAMYEGGYKGPYSLDEHGIIESVIVDDGNGGGKIRPASNFEKETWEQMRDENSKSLDELYSNNAGQTCEVCNNSSINCVCEVIYKHFNHEEKHVKNYYWRDRSDGKSAIPKIIYGIKKISINYEVKGMCDYKNKSNHCTDIYYYNRNVERDKNYKLLTIDEVQWKSKSTDKIEFEYSTDLAKTVHLDKHGKEVLIKNVDDNDLSGIFLISRSLSFLFWGQLNELPLTAYKVGAVACSRLENYLNVRTYEKLQKQTLSGTDATIAIAPTYKATAKISVGFGEYQDSKIKIKEEVTQVTDRLTYTHETKTEESGGYKFKIEGELKDYINGNEAELTFDLLEIAKYAEKLPVPLNYVGKFAKYLDVPIFEFLRKSGMGFTITPILPLITISGEANLEHKNNELFINRQDVLLKAEPLIGFTLEADLIELFLLKPPIKAIAEKVGNSIKRLSKHAKINAMTEAQAKAAIERSKVISVDGELIIYANFRFKCDIETHFSVISGNINEDASKDTSNNSTNAQELNISKKKAKGLNYIGASAAFEVEAGASFELEVTAFFGAFKASAGAKAALNISGKGYVAYENYIINDSNPEDIQTEWEGKIWHDGILMRYILSASAKADIGGGKKESSINTHDPNKDSDYQNIKDGTGGYSDAIILVDARKKEEGWNI